MMEQPKNIFICPFCGHLTKIVWVHGHGQCLICGTTIDECCRGEQANPMDESDAIDEEKLNHTNSNIKNDDEANNN
jgi:hypothetical protein